MRFEKELLLGLLVAACFFGAETLCVRADISWRDVRNRVDEDCARFGSANPGSEVCSFDSQPVVKLLKPAKEHVRAAREALAKNDREQAKVDLASAMATAAEVGKRRTLVAELVATSIVDDVLPLLESNDFDRGAVDWIVEQGPKKVGDRSLEAARVHRDFMAVYGTEEVPFLGTGFGDALLNGAMKDNARVYGAMETAVERGDLAACERATDLRGPFSTPMSKPLEDRMCERYMHVHTTAARLNRLRRRS